MSVELRMECKGVEEFQRKVRHLDATMKRNVHNRLSELAESIKALAMRLAPMRTGYLRSTIFAQVREWMIIVGAYAHYAVFVEFGTRFMRAFQFLRGAIEVHLPQLKQIIDHAIEESIQEASR